MCKGAQALRTLGLSRTATQEQLKTAYLALAKKWHPDRHQGGSKDNAEERFKELQQAYQFLSEPGGLRAAVSGQSASSSEPGHEGYRTSHARRRATTSSASTAGRAGSENWWGDEKRYGAAHRAGYNPHGAGYMGFGGKEGGQHWYEDTSKAAKEVDQSRMVRSWISVALFGAGLYAVSYSSSRDKQAKERGDDAQACVFKRAAHLAAESVARWQRVDGPFKGSLSIIKNCAWAAARALRTARRTAPR
jgi:curved DNA-binding protein CbpA